ncbi:MAG: EutN/CcmL family microcompartment protein [Armatimonadota bacterium]
MRLARVIGSVVSTIKHPAYQSTRLMIVEPIGLDLKPRRGRTWIAVDAVGAGVGETVLTCEQGRSAAQVLRLPSRQPVRSVIVGIVDHIHVEGVGTIHSR